MSNKEWLPWQKHTTIPSSSFPLGVLRILTEEGVQDWTFIIMDAGHRSYQICKINSRDNKALPVSFTELANSILCNEKAEEISEKDSKPLNTDKMVDSSSQKILQIFSNKEINEYFTGKPFPFLNIHGLLTSKGFKPKTVSDIEAVYNISGLNIRVKKLHTQLSCLSTLPENWYVYKYYMEEK